MASESRSFTTTPAIAEIWTRDSLARRVVERLLPSLQAGRLQIALPSGEVIDRRTDQPGPEAVITLNRWRALWRLMRDGDSGLGRGYLDGDWWTPNLGALLELGMRNEAALAASAGGWWLAHALSRLRHSRRANTRRGSRRNIAAHYDLGNAFYSHWLDRGMNYSSALYRRGDETLEEAQEAKLDRAISLLEIAGGERVLEIGCGWGGLAERLVRDHRCAVTGLTLSTEQLAYARSRLASETSSCGIDLRLQDYRDVNVDDRYDRIVSIEMLEAVGERFWQIYFEKLRACLTEEGIAVLQVITIDQSRFAAYRRRPDFVQRYIFPGGMLPTMDIIRREAERVGLALVAHESFGDSYARTLQAWRQRFLRAWSQIEPLGFDQRFRRMWEYYLTYCEVGFRFEAVNVSFFKLVRPAFNSTRCAWTRT
jgi:cyclopropane-fatty-acyl-phospholipid synthase